MDLLQKLAGGDRRSVGRVDEVVADVLADPALFATLFDGMLHPDPLIRIRAADAVEKIAVHRSDLLQTYKNRLIHEVAQVNQQEVRWHVAQLFSRLHLSPDERRTIVAILTDYLTDKSRIVRTFAMQALADIAAQDDALRPAIIAQLEDLTHTGSPAMQSRGRKLLAALQPDQPKP